MPTIDSTALPSLSARTHCVLMPRDPHVIFAYWDYSTADMERLEARLQSAAKPGRLVLRVNGPPGHAQDIEIGPCARNAYIHVGQDNAGYSVDVGIVNEKNHFTALSHSNTVRTPPETSSTRNDLIWQDITPKKESPPFIREEMGENIKEEGKIHGQEPVHRPSQQPSAAKTSGPGSAQGPSRKYHPEIRQAFPRIYQLTAQDIRAYYLKLFHGQSKRRAGRQASLAGIIKGMAGIPWEKVVPLVISPELGRIHPGGSERSAQAKKGASENLLAERASEGRLNKRGFFFEISTELVVHGRTEPGATVLLNEKEIELNPDGTFSLRYALPDGEIPLQFMARSADQREERHIQTRAAREKTVYFPKMLKGPHGQ
jgi:hypothetical protein